MKRSTWSKRVAGQIRDCARQHPDYFNKHRFEACVNSLTKRIVGEAMMAWKREIGALGLKPDPSESEAGKRKRGCGTSS